MVQGHAAYLTPSFGSDFPSLPAYPSVSIGIKKFDNGYMLSLATYPKSPKPPKVKRPPNPFAGQDPDEIIDRIIDGAGSMLRCINEKSAGEDWKDGENRQNVREAFRVMFQNVAHSVDELTQDVQPPEYEEPRHESLVFETKEALFEYLTKNL